MEASNTPILKKKKVILVKKKKSTTSEKPAIVNPPPIQRSPFDELGLDPNIFGLMGAIPNMMSEKVMGKLASIPEDEIANMSEQEISEFVLKQLNLPYGNSKSKDSKSDSNEFDMSKMMAELMTNATKMVNGDFDESQSSGETEKDPNAFPSLYNEAPSTERSGKYYDPKKEKKEHIIYNGFNLTLLSVFNVLSAFVPGKAAMYDQYRRVIQNFIAIDPTKPMEMWQENIKGYESRLEKFSDENLDFICKNIDNIQILKMLELKDVLPTFDKEQQRTLWDKLALLHSITDMTESIPVEMMTAIQQMTISVNEKQPLELDANGNPKNTSKLFTKLAGEVFKNREIFKGMKSMSENLLKTMTENQLPESPAFNKLLQKEFNN